MLKYRKIKADEDEVLAGIIRANLETLHLNIPGTAYFDPELDHLSVYYNSDQKKCVSPAYEISTHIFYVEKGGVSSNGRK